MRLVSSSVSRVIGKSALVFGLAALSLGLLGCGGSDPKTDPDPVVTPDPDPVVTPDPDPVVIPDPDPAFEDPDKIIKAQGTYWVDAEGNALTLKGTNLGNWLVQEFWMMGQGSEGVHDQCTLEAKFVERFGYAEKERLIKLFRDSWMTERDWDVLQEFGFNLIRIPILWSVIEDENNPKTLRADAWDYIDWAIEEAAERGMYVILDLHGAHGGQTPNDHTGCSGQNQYWTNLEFQDRTRWLWQQIATRYKDNHVVAAYDVLNEPWGSTPEAMAERIEELYDVVREIDTNHVVLLAGYYWGFEVYGDPHDSGMENVAIEMHPYPGLFGDRPNDRPYEIHRDFLMCGEDGQGGVCNWESQLDAIQVPFLVGEFQPWQGLGMELGGRIGAATYERYAEFGWAATSWTYKIVSPAGGIGEGNWGTVTNAADPQFSGLGLVAKASTWDCAGWDSSFADACAKKSTEFTLPGSGSKTFYLAIKAGAVEGANPQVAFDDLALVNVDSGENKLLNGTFDDSSAWQVVQITGEVSFTFADNSPGNQPEGANGSVLLASRGAGAGLINGAVYQAIELEGGQTYRVDGLFKDSGSADTWAEVYLVDEMPEAGVDILGGAAPVDFSNDPIEDIEALFSSYATQEYEYHTGLLHWLTTDEENGIFDLPATPTNLTINESDNSVDLTWDVAVDEGVTFNVYRSNNAFDSGEIIAEGLTANTYTDDSIEDGYNYFYSIVAVKGWAESFRSNQVHTALLPVDLPARIEAENFNAMDGVVVESSSDTGGGNNVGWLDQGDWLEYDVVIATGGTYTIDYRVASDGGSTGFELWVNGQQIDSQSIEDTTGWQTWATVSSTIELPAGEHTLRFNMLGGGGWNLNWFEVSE